MKPSKNPGPKPATKTLTLTVTVPEDYDYDEEERQWVEYIMTRAAARGMGMEDTEACYHHQYGHEHDIKGAKLAQGFLLRLAGKAFAERNDREAELYRRMADSLDDLLKDLEKDRAEHEKLFLTSYHETVNKARAERATEKAA